MKNQNQTFKSNDFPDGKQVSKLFESIVGLVEFAQPVEYRTALEEVLLCITSNPDNDGIMMERNQLSILFGKILQFFGNLDEVGLTTRQLNNLGNTDLDNIFTN